MSATLPDNLLGTGAKAGAGTVTRSLTYNKIYPQKLANIKKLVSLPPGALMPDFAT